MSARRLVALLFVVGAAACRSTPSTPASVPLELVAQTCGAVSPLTAFGELYLAGQPSAADLAEFARRGLRRVITLRHDSEPIGFDERAAAGALGLEYVQRPWNGAAQLDDAVFADCRALLSQASVPTLVHCGSANRVGAVWIAWRALDWGVPVEQAVAEARRIGLSSAAYESKARDYVARNTR